MYSILAQFWGLMFVILGAVFLIRRENITLLIKTVADDSMILLTGYLSLMIGVMHVVLYNNWSTNDWRIILTLIGWAALVKGVLRLAFPSLTQRIIKSYDKPVVMAISLVVLIMLGGFLLMKGYDL